MLRPLRHLLTIGLLYLAVSSTAVFAPTPPENHSLREFRPGALQADKELDEWLRTLQESSESLMQLESSKLDEKLKNFDSVTALFLKLKRSSNVSSQGQQNELVKDAVSQFNMKSKTLLDHSLSPYLWQLLLDQPGLDTKDQASLRAAIIENGATSCPRKKLLLQDMRIQEKASLTTAQAKKYLNMLREFSSLGFVEDGLRSLLFISSPQALSDLRSELAIAIQPYARLVEDASFLFDKQASDVKQSQEQSAILMEAEKSALAGHCTVARDSLVKALKSESENARPSLLAFDASAERVDSCFKSKSQKSRVAFWQELEDPLKVTYGFPGEALVWKRLGLIAWVKDDFEEAKKAIRKIMVKAEKDFPIIYADALFTYARITENEGKFDEAIASYQDFTTRFPQHEQLNQALSSLIILSSHLKNLDASLIFALKMVESEALKPIDDRDGGSLPMALYWIGKISYEKGELKNAEFYWRRLAQEYYSTFYGALGHLSLERLTGKRYLLPPVHAPRFERAEIFASFSEKEKQIFDRTEKLLRIGMKDEAACEMREIQTEPSDTHRQLAKAIFQYAAGDWLAAVKLFQNLPKSYRLTLPKGMERILFPRAFGELVADYTTRAKLDPQFINAIIRQESVFNPRAKSSVGARGLMQLMPATARMESRTIPSDYLGAPQLAKVGEVISNEGALNDPEVNIALGVHHVRRLLQKYKSPVFVLTSYNANPRATERWLESIDSSDMLIFIERIPYRETRSYVKLVMRNYFYYKRWYEGVDAPIPLFDDFLPSALADNAKIKFQASSLR